MPSMVVGTATETATAGISRRLAVSGMGLLSCIWNVEYVVGLATLWPIINIYL